MGEAPMPRFVARSYRLGEMIQDRAASMSRVNFRAIGRRLRLTRLG
jgi:hypothetical protein